MNKYYDPKKIKKLSKKRYVIIISPRESGKRDFISRLFEERKEL